MRSDPEPLDAVGHRHTESAVMNANQNAAVAAVCDELEMQ